MIDKYKFDATTIFNMDETYLSMVQKPGKTIAAKVKHQVGSIVSADGFLLSPYLLYNVIYAKHI